MISFAGGARGLLYCRYRPLLDGPLFGAFGAIGLDGSATPRAQMAAKTLRWANSNADIWKSRPIRGDVGLLFVPEAELFNYVQQLSTDFYSESIRGAYQAFFDQNIQADFVALENIDEYKLIYLAYPVMMRPQTVARLKGLRQQGGHVDLRRIARLLRRARPRWPGSTELWARRGLWGSRDVCRVSSRHP